MKAVLLTVCALAAAPAPAQEPDWSQAQRIEIDLRNFKYTPDVIALEHGRPYVLHFVNQARGGHDFVAPRFFAAATLSSVDKGLASSGAIGLRGGEMRDVRLIAPASGSYDAHCSHFMHSTFGMRARIVVS